MEFDDPKAGENLRLQNPRHPSQPRLQDHGRLLTPISKVSFEYPLGDPEKDHAAKTKVIQFPIQLAWAITAHKCQGMTIKPPTKLVADIDSCWSNAAGMAYVMLGRIQNLDQLILRWSYDPHPKSDEASEKKRCKGNITAAKKIKANAKAMVEAEKMKKNAINLQEDDWIFTKRGLKITSLNIQGGLVSRLVDIERDKAIYPNSDIICLQETGPLRAMPVLNGYVCKVGGNEHHRGVAIFLKEETARKLIKEPQVMEKQYYQWIKLSFDVFDLITVYRANNQPSPDFQEFVKVMEREGVDANRPTILCGDLNFDRRDNNDLTKMLRSKKLKQIVQEPTTYRGNCIDHVYHNIPDHGDKVMYQLQYPYYSDHEAVCVRIPMFASSCNN